MIAEYEELGVHRRSFYRVPANVTYRYIDGEEDTE